MAYGLNSAAVKSGIGQGLEKGAANLKLPPRHQRFIAEYLACLNGTEAARRAGYSSKTANEQGSQLLAKLSAYIAPQVTADLETRLMSADEIVDKLQHIATTNVSDFMAWDGKAQTLTLKNPDQIPPELRQCIESITQHETQHVKYLKIKLHSKVAALGMLAKYHNLFKRTVASKGLNVHIHVANSAQPTKTPIVVNAKENGQALEAPKVAFAFAPGTTNGHRRDAGHGRKSNRSEQA